MEDYRVDFFSLPSLRVEPLANGNSLGNATGFIVQQQDRFYLVTNWHVVTGRNSETGKIMHDSCATPDTLRIFHHSSLTINGYGAWTFREEPLYSEDGTPRWVEHPKRDIKNMENYWESNVDVAVLPLSQTKDVALHPLDISSASADIYVAPGLTVSIIGYPLGLFGADFFPIWKTGHLASDIDAHNLKRHFFIDATTKVGMSGSPVVFRAFGMYQNNRGDTVFSGSVVTRFLGVYSGRVHPESDIGIVWRSEILEDILNTLSI